MQFRRGSGGSVRRTAIPSFVTFLLGYGLRAWTAPSSAACPPCMAERALVTSASLANHTAPGAAADAAETAATGALAFAKASVERQSASAQLAETCACSPCLVTQPAVHTDAAAAVGAGQAIPVATGEAEEPQLLERGAASRPWWMEDEKQAKCRRKWEAYRANRTVETPGNQWNEKFSSPVSTMLDPWFLWHASQTKTDKVTTHAYHYIYTRYLAHARFSELNVLEIGLGCNMEYGPGASLSIWRSYLPCSNISFLEYDRACAEKFKESIEREAGGRLFIGSQDDPALLADVAQYAKTFGGFDLIVDDGSHKQEHMMASLDALWESVKPGGVYVMEDLTGWWNHDEWVWSTTSPNVNQPHTKHTTAWPIIRQLLDNVNCHCQGGPNWTSFRTWCKAQEGTKWGTVVAFEAMPEAVVLVKGTADVKALG